MGSTSYDKDIIDPACYFIKETVLFLIESILYITEPDKIVCDLLKILSCNTYRTLLL